MQQARRREEAESLKAAAESLSRLSRQLGAELDRALGAQAVLLGGVGRVQADTALLDAKARDYVDRFVELQGKLMRMGFKEEVRMGGGRGREGAGGAVLGDACTACGAPNTWWGERGNPPEATGTWLRYNASRAPPGMHQASYAPPRQHGTTPPQPPTVHHSPARARRVPTHRPTPILNPQHMLTYLFRQCAPFPLPHP